MIVERGLQQNMGAERARDQKTMYTWMEDYGELKNWLVEKNFGINIYL